MEVQAKSSLVEILLRWVRTQMPELSISLDDRDIETSYMVCTARGHIPEVNLPLLSTLERCGKLVEKSCMACLRRR